MGYYLEPQSNCPGRPAKKAYLDLEGIKLPFAEWPSMDDTALICLIYNGSWYAAGVCFSKAEMAAFMQPDARERTWYWLPKDKCYEAMDPSTAKSLRESF